MTTKLPSRADHVGSFLRPRSVIEAREHRAAGNIDYSELRAIEDKAIAELVKWQESLGLKAITDGEFRRYFFHTDFLLQLDGVEEHGGIAKAFKNDAGKDVHFAPPKMVVSGKVRHVKPIQLADFEYLASLVTRDRPRSRSRARPCCTSAPAGRAFPRMSIRRWTSSTPTSPPPIAPRSTASPQAGCRYIQMDDTNLAYLCDDTPPRRCLRARGRSRRHAAPVRQADQRQLRQRAGRHDQGDPLVPRQLPLELGRRGRL